MGVAVLIGGSAIYFPVRQKFPYIRRQSTPALVKK